MPKNIQTEDIKRMFPFEFYDELNENMQDYKLHNPAFMLANVHNFDKEKRREIYTNMGKDIQKKAQETLKTLHSDNIIEAEPIGEVLLLDICIKKEDIDALLNDDVSDTEKSQQDLCILAVQLYDSSDLPVFSKDVVNESIQQIPEILWDEPNLGIYVIVLNEDGATIGVVTMPKRIHDKIFETKENTDE